jgi:hypothetical protein
MSLISVGFISLDSTFKVNYRRPRIRQKYLIVFEDYAKSLLAHTEITTILQWFYLNEVISKYAKSILAYTENKFKEYIRIRWIRQKYL